VREALLRYCHRRGQWLRAEHIVGTQQEVLSRARRADASQSADLARLQGEVARRAASAWSPDDPAAQRARSAARLFEAGLIEAGIRQQESALGTLRRYLEDARQAAENLPGLAGGGGVGAMPSGSRPNVVPMLVRLPYLPDLPAGPRWRAPLSPADRQGMLRARDAGSVSRFQSASAAYYRSLADVPTEEQP
jgi:hypothetical protein